LLENYSLASFFQAISADGCDGLCGIERGFSCQGNQPDVCTPLCGDGIVIGSEQCDDNNNRGADGCSQRCLIEEGFQCVSQPSRASFCSPLISQSDGGVEVGVIVGPLVAVIILVAILICGAVGYFVYRRSKGICVVFFPLPIHQTILEPSPELELENTQFRAANEGLLKYKTIPKKQTEAALDFSELAIDQEIGSGNFGVVYRGTWRLVPVAVKQLKTEAANQKELDEFEREAQLLKNLRPHANIVLFFGFTAPPQPTTIVLEFCSGGSLLKIRLELRKSFGKKKQCHWS